MIVDDNADAINSLAALLEPQGHKATPAYSAAEALERAQTLRPDVVLLDIGWPEMNVYEVARRLRQLPELTSTRIVAVSGYGQPEDRQRRSVRDSTSICSRRSTLSVLPAC